MEQNQSPSSLTSKVLSNNQNLHRLKTLKPITSFSANTQAKLKVLLSSTGDKAHQAAGTLIQAILSKGQPVVVVSTRDLDALLKHNESLLADGAFSVREKRKSKDGSGSDATIWSQMTGFLKGHIQILKPQEGRVPAVVELIDKDFITLMPESTDELRLQVINSTSKAIKYSSMQQFLQLNESNKTNNPTSLTTPTTLTTPTSISEPQIINFSWSGEERKGIEYFRNNEVQRAELVIAVGEALLKEDEGLFNLIEASVEEGIIGQIIRKVFTPRETSKTLEVIQANKQKLELLIEESVSK